MHLCWLKKKRTITISFLIFKNVVKYVGVFCKYNYYQSFAIGLLSFVFHKVVQQHT